VKKILLTFSLLSIIATAQAQYSKLRVGGFFQRLELGVSYNQFRFDHKQIFTAIDNTIADRVTYDNKSPFSIGGYIGSGFRLAKFKANRTMVLAIGVQANLIQWDHFGWNFNPLSSGWQRTEIEGTSLQFGLPIGLDFKFGAEAELHNAIKNGASIGFGIIPQYTMTTDMPFTGFDNTTLSYNPYIRAEVGLFGAVGVKLRGQVVIGTSPIIKSEDALAQSIEKPSPFIKQYDVIIDVPAHYSLSLILQPFAFTWGKENWWLRKKR
jgi:hypothetical protein